MSALRELKNIGAVVAAELEDAGIADAQGLREAGAVGAALRLRTAGYDVCRSKLAGLEGALRDVKWNLIPAEERKALWERLESFVGER